MSQLRVHESPFLFHAGAGLSPRFNAQQSGMVRQPAQQSAGRCVLFQAADPPAACGAGFRAQYNHQRFIQARCQNVAYAASTAVRCARSKIREIYELSHHKHAVHQYDTGHRRLLATIRILLTYNQLHIADQNEHESPYMRQQRCLSARARPFSRQRPRPRWRQHHQPTRSPVTQKPQNIVIPATASASFLD